jgi:hypothetical protein
LIGLVDAAGVKPNPLELVLSCLLAAPGDLVHAGIVPKIRVLCISELLSGESVEQLPIRPGLFEIFEVSEFDFKLVGSPAMRYMAYPPDAEGSSKCSMLKVLVLSRRIVAGCLSVGDQRRTKFKLPGPMNLLRQIQLALPRLGLRLHSASPGFSVDQLNQLGQLWE